MAIADAGRIRWLLNRYQDEPWADYLVLAVWIIVTTAFVAFHVLGLYDHFRGRK